MFRLLRLIIFSLFAFVAGIFYERSHAGDRCTAGGGLWIDKICVGVELTND